MAIHVALHHSTAYSYDRHVQHAPHVIRLRPAPHCRTKILSYSLKIHGGEYFINWQQDPFSNWNARLVFPTPLKELVVEIGLVAEMAVYNPFDFFLEDSASFVPFEYDPALARDLAPFLVRDKVGPRLQSHIKPLQKLLGKGSGSSSPNKLVTADFLVALNRQIQECVRYQIRLEPGVQSAEETLEKKSGSCRDSAWLMCELLASRGKTAKTRSKNSVTPPTLKWQPPKLGERLFVGSRSADRAPRLHRRPVAASVSRPCLLPTTFAPRLPQ